VTLRSSLFQLLFGLCIASIMVGCGGAPKQAHAEDSWEKQPVKSSDDATSGGSSGSSGSSDGTDDTKWTGASEPTKLNEEQVKQMEIALTRGRGKAANCSTVVENAPTGEGTVDVTFDGKIGKITEVEVGPPFAGTSVESCIKRSFIGEYCLPFDGDPKVVKYKVKLPAKGAPAEAPKKK
jgi:hypothetical protein